MIVNRLGHYLQQQGVQPGDRVALVLPNTPAFIFAYFGHSNALSPPINPVWTADELFCLSRCSLPFRHSRPAVKRNGRYIRNGVPYLHRGPQARTWESIVKSGDDSPLEVPICDTDLAVFITHRALPKAQGAMLTHRNLLQNDSTTSH